MFYSVDTIKNLGFETMKDFVVNYTKSHPNCIIRYVVNGIHIDYDFDTADSMQNVPQPVILEQYPKKKYYFKF